MRFVIKILTDSGALASVGCNEKYSNGKGSPKSRVGRVALIIDIGAVFTIYNTPFIYKMARPRSLMMMCYGKVCYYDMVWYYTILLAV